MMGMSDISIGLGVDTRKGESDVDSFMSSTSKKLATLNGKEIKLTKPQSAGDMFGGWGGTSPLPSKSWGEMEAFSSKTWEIPKPKEESKSKLNMREPLPAATKYKPADTISDALSQAAENRKLPASFMDTEWWQKDTAMYTGQKDKKPPTPTPGMEQRKFLMPFLSIMFGAMAAQKALQGLVAPAEKLVGIQEILNTMLEMFFLPIMLWLLDPLFWLFDIVTSLDESLQMTVGAFVMVGVIVAGVVVLLAQFAMAVSGIMALWGIITGGGAAAAGGTAAVAGGGAAVGTAAGGAAVGTAAGGTAAGTAAGGAAAGTAAAGGTAAGGGVGGGIGAALGAAAIPLLIIGAIIAVIILAWDRFVKLVMDLATIVWDFVSGAFNNIILFLTGLVKIFAGVIGAFIGIIMIAFGVIVGIFTGNWSLLTDGIKVFVEGLGSIFQGLVMVVISVLGQIWLIFSSTFRFLFTLFGGVLEMIAIALTKIITWLVDTFMPDLKQPWTDFVNWIGTLWTGIGTTITDILNPIVETINGIISATTAIATGGTSAVSGGDLIPIPFWDDGGYVSATAPGLLHAGEYVVPRGGALISEGGGGDNVTVNVYADVANDVDINRLADEISRIWHSESRRGA
jgi:hypothetical protein